MHAVDRNNVEMYVGNLEAGDHEPDFGGTVGTVERLADLLCNPRDVSDQAAVQVEPVIDFVSRNDECVPFTQWRYREERDAAFVLPNEPARQFAVDDPGEDGSQSAPFDRRDDS